MVGKLGASFRDPSGFVFRCGDRLYRQVNKCYAPHYDTFTESGLYEALVRKGLLIEHEEVDQSEIPATMAPCSYRVIRPALVPYVSYPYEWCFSQLKDAALLTLEIQAEALEHGMTLKDASAFNVQFIGARPVFIDTLSFEKYTHGAPWIAYRQFCQHFLGPLAVMAYCDVRLRHLLKSYIDGLPIDLVSTLLPRRTRAKYSLLAHIHLHASSQKRHQHDARDGLVKKQPSMSKRMQLALAASLRNAVDKCRLSRIETEWGEYYEDTNYTASSMLAKERLVQSLVAEYCDPGETIHDVGGNTGRFSRLAAAAGHYVLSHDIDELAVERNYQFNRSNGVDNVLPLVLDLGNPTPSLGWALQERDSLLQRIGGDVVMALALIHHIAISNNVPMDEIARFFNRLARTLIIEFVPKEDSQVKRLLATRRDIFPDYNVQHFEQTFGQYFEVLDKQHIVDTQRTMFVFRRRE